MDRKDIEKCISRTEVFLEHLKECKERAIHNPVMGQDNAEHTRESGVVKHSYQVLKYELNKYLTR